MTQALHVVSKGSADQPAVVGIHGLLGSSRNLHRLMEAVAAAGFHAIAPVLPGHGHSAPPECYALPALAAAVFSALDARNVESARLVGHSLGARVALAAAELDPGRIKALILLDAGTRIGERALSALRAIIDPLPLSFADKSEAERALSSHDAAMKQFLLSNLRNKDGGFGWIFDLEGVRSKLLPALSVDQSVAWKNLRIPALVVRGERSEHFTQAEVDRMLAANPGARAATVPNAGHWVHVDNFVDTARIVTGFLNEVEGR